MNKLIDFFLKNSKLNYTIIAFIVVMGVFAYINIPKEIFPPTSLNKIEVDGSYAGASANSLNNFAVTEIENQINSISGIDKVISRIRSGTFSIEIDLQDGTNKMEVLNQVKDAVAEAKQYFPSDMTDPTVTAVKRNLPLMWVALTSDTIPNAKLVKISDDLKSALLQVTNVSDIGIYGNTQLEINLYLDTKKIDMYGLNSTSIVQAISNLSYMYPVGDIKQVGNHIYLSANNNKLNADFWKNTVIKVGDKKVYLGDIANIEVGYPTGDTISRINDKKTISMIISKTEQGDAMRVSKNIKKVLKSFLKKHKGLSLPIVGDTSGPVHDRIQTIVANMMLGLILVGFSMYILISARLSFIIILGIPFSFILGLIFIDMMGYSLNMISMMAMVMALGIVVDDAIIVSENIQRYIDEGLSIATAVSRGTKEMVMPVLIAALTTIFAFLPMLLMKGEMGLMIRLVPIVMTTLIIASLIECFFFLPLHAKHTLKKNDKQMNWNKAYNLYEKILHKVIHKKKMFLISFFIAVPLLTAYAFHISRFQFFPTMDSNDITISVKLDDSKTLDETNLITEQYEKLLLKNMKKLYIKTIISTVGEYKNIRGRSELIDNGFDLSITLDDYKSSNFIEKYINPVLSLSFDFAQKNKIRQFTKEQEMDKIRALLDPLLKADKAVEHNIVSNSVMRFTKSDIAIKLSSDDTALLIKDIDILKRKLATINGVKDIGDNTQLGEEEYKYSVNDYGKSLGLTDTSIADSLSSYFLKKEQANTFNKDGIIKIITQSKYKNSLQGLKDFNLPLDNDQFVQLKDVVNFKITRSFEKIRKENGNIFKNVYANVENKIINSDEVLAKLAPEIARIRAQGTLVEFGGEKKQNTQLKFDMMKAAAVAMFLIFITLLINFPSFKSALMILSVIPLSILGPIVGHFVVGINLNSQSMIGMLGLAGVVVNDGIVMLDFLKDAKTKKDFFTRAKQRIRPIIITSLTTMLGLFTLIFFPTGESLMLQPIAVSLGFGIAWGTVLNLIYIPAMYATIFKIKD